MPPMSMYKRLNKAQSIRLCENREIDVDRCKTKAHLIELLLEADEQGETKGVGQAPSDEGDDDLEMAGHEVGSDAAEEVVGMEDERSMFPVVPEQGKQGQHCFPNFGDGKTVLSTCAQPKSMANDSLEQKPAEELFVVIDDDNDFVTDYAHAMVFYRVDPQLEQRL